ncbi:hypothetical protein WISP_125873 [Willisornis vidua]|uniref:Craniofacial development protein 2-like n=1 Tax=Willisornis vidua TaxID=1566151 RepID=A0ABQ9CQY5_9PASS|nr:hypothetical protein WISP_125873 [Willisornis vidua]
MIKNSIASKLENMPTGHFDRIMSVRLPLHNKQHVFLLSICVPTLQADPAEKYKFYTNLCRLTQKVPADDKIIILGDFNARVGGVTSIEAMLMRTQLRWAGHVSRMEDHHLPKIVLYGELVIGCCERGAPKRRYKDSLKQYLSLGHIDCHQWSILAFNLDSWRHTIHDAAASFGNTHRVSLEEK